MIIVRFMEQNEEIFQHKIQGTRRKLEISVHEGNKTYNEDILKE